MNVVVTVGNVLDASADVLISTANPWLNMSGGVNGAIRVREPNFQSELRALASDRHVKNRRLLTSNSTTACISVYFVVTRPDAL